MRLIIPNIPSLRTLVVKRVPQKILRIIFDRLAHISAPHLQTLTVKSSGTTSWSTEGTPSKWKFKPFIQGEAPSLRELNLGRINPSYTINQFKDLHYVGLKWSGVFGGPNATAYNHVQWVQELLTILPNLKYILPSNIYHHEDWDDSDDLHQLSTPLPPPLTHANLTHIAIGASAPHANVIIASLVRIWRGAHMPVDCCCASRGASLTAIMLRFAAEAPCQSLRLWVLLPNNPSLAQKVKTEQPLNLSPSSAAPNRSRLNMAAKETIPSNPSSLPTSDDTDIKVGARPRHKLSNVPYDIFLLIAFLCWDDGKDKYYSNFPIIASHVCRTWRRYALDTGVFWATLGFRQARIHPAVMKYKVVKYAKAIMRLIMPHVSHWRSFRVDRVPKKISRLIFDRLRDASAPMLESLTAIGERARRHFQPPTTTRCKIKPFVRGEAPSLIELVVVGFPHDYFLARFTYLQVLQLTQFEFSQAGEIENV
ncbi:hypothetical protein FRC01_009211, partial [Tulasnella sp. 417]